MKKDMYICECCKNPKSCYCKDHVQGNLFWAKYDIMHLNKHHYVAICDDCYQYRLEELEELQKNGAFTEIKTLTKEDIIPTSV
jgi:hypothetical protein